MVYLTSEFKPNISERVSAQLLCAQYQLQFEHNVRPVGGVSKWRQHHDKCNKKLIQTAVSGVAESGKVESRRSAKNAIGKVCLFAAAVSP